jgi:hypothetical protein
MDLEGRAKELLRHRRAFDVPTGTPAPPGRVPGGVLALFRGLPEGEVARVLLERARVVVLHLLRPLAREAAVLGKARDAEVDVSPGLVRVLTPHELLDQRNDLRNRLRRLGLMVRAAKTEPLGVVDIPL